eukprot:1052001-Pyramimonas_sp.AAC.5
MSGYNSSSAPGSRESDRALYPGDAGDASRDHTSVKHSVDVAHCGEMYPALTGHRRSVGRPTLSGGGPHQGGPRGYKCGVDMQSLSS